MQSFRCFVLVILAYLKYVYSYRHLRFPDGKDNLLGLQTLTCDQIRQFVDGHNLRRLLVARGEIRGQPPATDMKYLVWDNDLVEMAEKWAISGNSYHDKNRKIVPDKFHTGKNMYELKTTFEVKNININGVLNSWFSENKDFKINSDKPNLYTQMVWSKTNRIGCAISQNKSFTRYVVLCVYARPGNILGRFPYQPGEPKNYLICGNHNCSKPYGDQCKQDQHNLNILSYFTPSSTMELVK